MCLCLCVFVLRLTLLSLCFSVSLSGSSLVSEQEESANGHISRRGVPQWRLGACEVIAPLLLPSTLGIHHFITALGKGGAGGGEGNGGRGGGRGGAIHL